MADRPPPRDPADDETIVSEGWGPESDVFVEQREELVEVEPPRRRMPTIWPWLLALLVLVLAGLGALYFLSRDDDDDRTAATTTSATTTGTTTAAAERSVPDVVGTTSSEATQTLRDAGFEVNLVPVPSDRPPGTVVAQAPAANSEQPEGTTIRLNVAEAAGSTTGETTGETTTGATTTGATTTSTTTTTATPTPPRPAAVPDVVGQELAEAARAFADEGLKVAVASVPSTEAAGRVVAQARPAGTELRRGDTVQLNVSKGAEPQADTSVPRVTGQELEQARSALEQAGFEVLALTVGDREVKNESTILSQSPGGGASVPRGSLVLLYV